MRILGVIIASLALVPVLASRVNAAVTFTFDSQGFEAVGDGESGTYTDADGAWSVTGRGNSSTTGTFVGIRFGFSHDDPGVEFPGWTLEFNNADTNELQVGTYTNLGRDTDPTTTSMRISNDITCFGDDDPTNEFSVTAIEYDLYGRPIQFSGSFILRCAPDQAPLVGSIDYTFDGNIAAPGFGDGNILVMLDSVIYEYDPSGNPVQALPIRRGSSPPTFFGLDRRSSEPARDLAMVDGILYVFNEQSNLGQFTFSDRLSRLSTLFPTGIWRHDAFDDEWNSSVVSDSGLAVSWPFVFTVDGAVSGDARGLVRFNTLSSYAVQRFEDGEFYRDIAGGLDGQLYALRSSGSVVEVFDPVSLANVATIPLDANVNAIAVNAAGTIYAVGGTNEVTLYDFGTDGMIDNMLDMDPDLPFGIEMMDIDVSATGTIAIGLSEYGTSNPDGEFIISDETLAAGTLIEIDPLPNEQLTFVGFVVPLVPFLADGFESGDTSAWSATVP